jgi:hypothetical protein
VRTVQLPAQSAARRGRRRRPGRLRDWEIAAVSPTGKTATVRVGTLPPGFAQITRDVPATPLVGVVAVTMRTNFWYTAQIDLLTLAQGHEVRVSPQPVLTENAPVSPPRC